MSVNKWFYTPPPSSTPTTSGLSKPQHGRYPANLLHYFSEYLFIRIRLVGCFWTFETCLFSKDCSPKAVAHRCSSKFVFLKRCPDPISEQRPCTFCQRLDYKDKKFKVLLDTFNEYINVLLGTGEVTKL